MSPDLPAALRLGIARMVEGVSRKDIAQRCATMSRCYRAGGASSEAIADAGDAVAYLLTRLPATYAAAAAVLSELRERAPHFVASDILDIGSGPGSASWAATEAWPGAARVRMLDNNPIFLDIARGLAAQSGHPALSNANAIEGDLARAIRDLPAADFAIASYALAEFAENRAGEIAAALWGACTGILVLIEPGSPAGYRRILSCRTALIAAGATILAPCPHSAPCPIEPPDWCHFTRRLGRSRDHRMVKGGDLGFEDEKFCYLAVARAHVTTVPHHARVLAPPRKSKAGIALKLCEDGQIRIATIARGVKPDYPRYRNVKWGDPL